MPIGPKDILTAAAFVAVVGVGLDVWDVSANAAFLSVTVSGNAAAALETLDDIRDPVTGWRPAVGRTQAVAGGSTTIDVVVRPKRCTRMRTCSAGIVRQSIDSHMRTIREALPGSVVVERPMRASDFATGSNFSILANDVVHATD